MTRGRSDGFTLIEVMISMAILAILTTMIWQGFSQTVRNKERLEAISGREHGIRMALDRMQRELSMAYVSVHRNVSVATPAPLTAFIGKDRSREDRIDFSAFAHRRLFRNAKESDQCELSYFMARDPKDSDKEVLARREQAIIDDDPEKGGSIEIILHDIKALEFEYLDPISKEWVSTWDTTQAAMQPNRLPSQVKIRITMEDPLDHGKERVYGTRAIVPMVWALNHAAYDK